MTTLSECYFRVLEDLERQRANGDIVLFNIGCAARQHAQWEMEVKQRQAATEKAIDEVVK
jgi:hypothetical protein